MKAAAGHGVIKMLAGWEYVVEIGINALAVETERKKEDR